MKKPISYTNIHEELEQKYGSVHIWRMNDGADIFVSQGKNKGNVIASFGADGVLRDENRPLTESEMEEIQDFFLYQSEPHDIDNFKKDVFNVAHPSGVKN